MWKKKYNAYIFCIILLTPLWMWIAWLLSPKVPLQVTIIDKTVLNKKGQEHISLMWVLNHEKYAKHNGSLYKTSKDYYGFFPKLQETYEIKGLEKLSPAQLDSLADHSDIADLTDAYGIYSNEWYGSNEVSERSGIIYGGMSSQDVYYLEQMQARKKLVLTEFNCLGSPTEKNVRSEFEKAFKIHWTGWIGRYFDQLDTSTNRELPRWLVRDYVQQYGNWPFKKSGIAFIREDDKVVVLENETHLVKEIPVMIVNPHARSYYDLPERTDYSFWFDVIASDTINSVLANFKIQANESGLSALKAAGIPAVFPAIISHNRPDYRFWYFACDFSDNPIGTTSSYFKGVHWFRRLFYNSTDPADRGGFFWNVYRPLVTKILSDYKKEVR